jgi:hypothetical protein
MFCPNCGRKVTQESSFCESCGFGLNKTQTAVVETASGISNPFFSINISKTKTLVFYERHLTYKGEQVEYKDVEGLSYLLTRTKHSIYFIPTHTSVSFQIVLEAKGRRHVIDGSTESFILASGSNLEDKQAVFSRIVYAIEKLVKPLVLINVLEKYAQQGLLNIDSLAVDSKGLHRKRFWRSPETVSWTEYYNSQLSGGVTTIYRSDPVKKYKPFFACSMAVMNAVLLPDILNLLFKMNGKVDTKTLEALKAKKEDMLPTTEGKATEPIKKSQRRFCESCAGPVGEADKFCTHCGSQLS